MLPGGRREKCAGRGRVLGGWDRDRQERKTCSGASATEEVDRVQPSGGALPRAMRSRCGIRHRL